MSDPEKTEETPVARGALLNRPQMFIGELVIDGKVLKSTMGALNIASLEALLTIATLANMPRISGWNVYSPDGKELLLSVNAIEFLAKLADSTGLVKAPADQKQAGWRALPVVSPTTQEFQDSIKKAKEEGKIPR